MIKLVSSLIETYPDLIGGKSFLNLLQLLQSMQVDDSNTIDYVYQCQAVLLDVQDCKIKDKKSEIDNLWKLIGESTLRAVGLNQNVTAAQTLLQKIIENDLLHLDNVIETYISSISINEFSLYTLELLLKKIDFSELGVSKKKDLFRSLLTSQTLCSYKCFLKPNFANILVSLMLKQCPLVDSEYNYKKSTKYKSLKDLYAKTHFEQLVILQNKCPVLNKSVKRSFNVDFELCNDSIEYLNLFIQNSMNETLIKSLSLICLLHNTLSYMLVYGLLNENELKHHKLFKNIGQILSQDFITACLIRYKTHNERLLKELDECVYVLTAVFSTKNALTFTIKEQFPLGFLRSLFDIFNFLEVDSAKKAEIQHKVKRNLIIALSNYCFVSNLDTLSECQHNLMSVLATPDYDYVSDTEFDLSITFLQFVTFAYPGSIPEDIIAKILDCVQGMCKLRFRSYNDSLRILSVLKGLHPHITSLENECFREVAVNLLYPFYARSTCYGPQVSLSLLECIGSLCKVGVGSKLPTWENIEIIRKVPEFLISEYQCVRFKAIETIVEFFKSTSKSTNLEDFHRQEEIFAELYDMSIKVFNVEGNFSNERRSDEIICRSASALHTFLALMITCNSWLEESLLAIIKLEHHKKLGAFEKIFPIISHLFSADGCMEKFLENIISKWISAGYHINEFQFKFFNCQDKFELYTRYFDVCLPILLTHDRNDLFKAAKGFNMSEKDVFQKLGTKIFAMALAKDFESLGEALMQKNIEVSYLNHVLGDNLKTTISENIDELIISLLRSITDEKLIYKCLGENVLFLSHGISCDVFFACLRFIEMFLYKGTNIIKFLCSGQLHKIQRIILELQLNIDSAIADQKIKNFHRYTVFVSLLMTNLNGNSNFLVYVLRDTIYFVIHLIKNNIAEATLGSACIKYLSTFLRGVLPLYAKHLEIFLMFVVNSLKNFALTNAYISKQCIDVLEFLLIENAVPLVKAIEKLDAFPQTEEFKGIRSVHNKIKYGKKEVTLEHEIKCFLEYDDMATRQDSLVYLKSVLAKEKEQLKTLFDKLANIQGFSEHCENSLLHKLVSVLVKMSCFPNESLNFEAIKCLGELGPANLMTLVLKPEERVRDLGCSAFQLLTGCVVYLLSQYLIDADVKVVSRSSDALYQVLKYKEGKKVVDSGTDYGFGVITKNYVLPYISSKTLITSKVKLDIQKFIQLVDDSDLWCPTETVTTDDWIISLVSAFLTAFDGNCFLPQLIPVCKVKAKFCEAILPLLVHLLLFINNQTVTETLSAQINEFFSRHWNLTVTNITNQDLIAVNKKSVKCMLDVINFVRQQSSFSKELGNLRLDYLRIANAAAFCSAHFTALFYGELWCQEKISEIEQNDFGNAASLENGYTRLDIIYESVSEEIGTTLQSILRSAYKAIGDIEALSGCGISPLMRPEFRVDHYKNLNQWGHVLHYYSTQLLEEPYVDSTNFMESLKMNRLYQLPLLCSDISEVPQYECLWRLGQWSTKKRDNLREVKISSDGYEKYRFYSIKALRDGDLYAFNESKRKLGLCVMESLKHISLESSKNLYPILSQLQSLIEIEDFSEANESGTFDAIFKKWHLQDSLIRLNDFQYVEPIMAQRLTLLNEFVKKRADLKQFLFETSLDFVDYAKSEGHVQVASNIIYNLLKIENLSEEIKSNIQLREAQLSWLRNDRVLAKHILSKLCKSESISPKLKANALRLQGEYMIETYSDSTIILNNFLKSLSLLSELLGSLAEEDHRDIQDTFDKIATFADKEYQQIMKHVKSDVFQKKVSNMKKCRELVKNMRQWQTTEDEKKSATIHHRQSDIDEIEINNAKAEKDKMLTRAVKYYLKSLILSDLNNIKIFRLMSLFLENRDNEKAGTEISKRLHEIPSYKYITMLPQLTPHISEHPTDLFGEKINAIIEKCAIEHPHHTLPLIMALVNSNKDREYSNSGTKALNNERISTAANMLQKLKYKHNLSDLINKMQQVAEALIELAYFVDPKQDKTNRRKEFEIPRTLKIHKIKNFINVLVPTYNLPVNKTNNYENITGISAFSTSYQSVGGINAPKRIVCKTTTGESHSQLVKGQDDLRQDAVMQQVFTIMNSLLSSNKQTRTLLIRTYKIVPLSMRSGVLKWNDNTMPIGHFLIGENGGSGAHSKFRPMDISPTDCRSLFTKCQKSPSERKLKVYNDICTKFKPVFHKFFETYFPQSTVWYERRRAYIYSVATSSMCGYILGIGDRHASNILIDKNTAEVIHIDFGIAFEQGKCLPTPETVPFRLSRDIVDGMGISGIEGLFRSACERTMEVLRTNAQTILTILEVLLYDPLYFWTVTAAEANKRQTDDEYIRGISEDSEEENKNISAERALLRLRSKLQGTEGGKQTSIEEQVDTLIQQAVNPVNLSRLFYGWQPYL
ncbi:serine-protein kinase ATM isoform X2 [Cylas formicarius]|uniref:serine-protein kinase ATM isoform X2 n=1 Tax=Cylas formicarius TaxID=197179 RepID=UPI002958C45E|nr:serine-protein kinase ATM isoform X2 [Cylas formicarius]